MALAAEARESAEEEEAFQDAREETEVGSTAGSEGTAEGEGEGRAGGGGKGGGGGGAEEKEEEEESNKCASAAQAWPSAARARPQSRPQRQPQPRWGAWAGGRPELIHPNQGPQGASRGQQTASSQLWLPKERSSKFRIGQQHLGSIIGKGGEVLKGIIKRTGAVIDIDQSTKSQGFSTVRIKPGPGARQAKELIDAKISAAEAVKKGTEDVFEMSLAQEAVGLVVGQRGETIRYIGDEAGAVLQFDQSTREKGFSTLRIGGSAEAIAKAKELVKEALAWHSEKEGGVKGFNGFSGKNHDEMRLSQDVVGFVIGPNGNTLRTIQQQTRTRLFMNQNTRDKGYSTLSISGADMRDVESARKAVEELVAKAAPGPHEGEVFRVQQSHVGFLLGRGGAHLAEIRELTGARVEVDQSTRHRGYSSIRVHGGCGARRATELIQTQIERAQQLDRQSGHPLPNEAADPGSEAVVELPKAALEEVLKPDTDDSGEEVCFTEPYLSADASRAAAGFPPGSATGARPHSQQERLKRVHDAWLDDDDDGGDEAEECEAEECEGDAAAVAAAATEGCSEVSVLEISAKEGETASCTEGTATEHLQVDSPACPSAPDYPTCENPPRPNDWAEEGEEQRQGSVANEEADVDLVVPAMSKADPAGGGRSEDDGGEPADAPAREECQADANTCSRSLDHNLTSTERSESEQHLRTGFFGQTAERCSLSGLQLAQETASMLAPTSCPAETPNTRTTGWRNSNQWLEDPWADWWHRRSGESDRQVAWEEKEEWPGLASAASETGTWPHTWQQQWAVKRGHAGGGDAGSTAALAPHRCRSWSWSREMSRSHWPPSRRHTSPTNAASSEEGVFQPTPASRHRNTGPYRAADELPSCWAEGRDFGTVTKQMRISQDQVGWLIGAGGVVIKQMHVRTGASLDLDQRSSHQGFSLLKITGTAQSVEEAEASVIRRIESEQRALGRGAQRRSQSPGTRRGGCGASAQVFTTTAPPSASPSHSLSSSSRLHLVLSALLGKWSGRSGSMDHTLERYEVAIGLVPNRPNGAQLACRTLSDSGLTTKERPIRYDAGDVFLDLVAGGRFFLDLVSESRLAWVDERNPSVRVCWTRGWSGQLPGSQNQNRGMEAHGEAACLAEMEMEMSCTDLETDVEDILAAPLRPGRTPYLGRFQ